MQKELGKQDRYPKKPMFAQDFEHILDNIGLETPALQRKWIKWKDCVTLYATNL